MILMFRLLKRLMRLCLPSVDVQKLDTLITDTAARAEDASAAMAAAVAAAASGMRLKGLVKDHGAKLRVLSMLSTPQVNAAPASGTAQGTAQVEALVVACQRWVPLLVVSLFVAGLPSMRDAWLCWVCVSFSTFGGRGEEEVEEGGGGVL